MQTLYYKVYGDKPDCIILHGLLGNSNNWQTHAKVLSERYRVWTLDLRNHGRSFHDPKHNVPAMAEDISVFMEEHGLKDAHFIGHSMGGKVLMYLALNYSHLVSSMVVVDMALRAYTPSHEGLARSMLSLDLPAYKTRREIEADLSNLFDPPLAKANLMLLMQNIVRTGAGFAWRSNLPVLLDAAEEMTQAVYTGGRKYSGKVLLVRGTRSDYVLGKDIEQMQWVFKRMKVLDLEAGHWVHIEAREEFLAAVVSFFG